MQFPASGESYVLTPCGRFSQLQTGRSRKAAGSPRAAGEGLGGAARVGRSACIPDQWEDAVPPVCPPLGLDLASWVRSLSHSDLVVSGSKNTCLETRRHLSIKWPACHMCTFRICFVDPTSVTASPMSG